MSAEPAQTEDQARRLHEIVQRLSDLAPNAAWAQWTETLATLKPILHDQNAFAGALATPEFHEAIRQMAAAITAAGPPPLRAAGSARKVSVSMPEDLTAAVQQRVGRGKFSQYVTQAVTRQLELDLLTELSELLTAEHGPVPEEYLAEARAAWPDDE